MNEVIQVSSTEEYFAEDRDQVYCRHGSYIGYPSGPDFICGPCEDGYNTLYQGVKFILAYRIWYPEEKLWGLWNEVDTAYSVEGKSKFKTFLDLFKGSDLQMESRVTEETYSYWGPETTCQHQDHEDCMNCCVCGECREDLDEDDYCPNCQESPNTMECDCGEVISIGDDGEWDEWNEHASGCSMYNIDW